MVFIGRKELRNQDRWGIVPLLSIIRLLKNGLLVYGRGVKQTDALEAIWKMKIQRWQLAWRIHWLKE